MIHIMGQVMPSRFNKKVARILRTGRTLNESDLIKIKESLEFIPLRSTKSKGVRRKGHPISDEAKNKISAKLKSSWANLRKTMVPLEEFESPFAAQLHYPP
jgi:hypothetical protein